MKDIELADGGRRVVVEKGEDAVTVINDVAARRGIRGARWTSSTVAGMNAASRGRGGHVPLVDISRRSDARRESAGPG